jgi:hypothetical protein
MNKLAIRDESVAAYYLDVTTQPAAWAYSLIHGCCEFTS